MSGNLTRYVQPIILGPSLRWDDGGVGRNLRHPSAGWDPGSTEILSGYEKAVLERLYNE
ncbi:hypothetical protein ACVW0Y_003677, partial [Pseudomonas sp. TE3786]